MSQSEQVARLRAEKALDRVTGAESDCLMHVGEYSTSYGGGSITSSLASEFVKHHSIGTKATVTQFFDPISGALVVIPEGGSEDWENCSGGD